MLRVICEYIAFSSCVICILCERDLRFRINYYHNTTQGCTTKFYMEFLHANKELHSNVDIAIIKKIINLVNFHDGVQWESSEISKHMKENSSKCCLHQWELSGVSRVRRLWLWWVTSFSFIYVNISTHLCHWCRWCSRKLMFFSN